jgi:hypothetical protein
MNLRRCASLLGILIALPLAGCNTLQTLSITPTTVNLTEVGQTAQYKAVGTFEMGSATPTTGAATVNWSSALTEVATINSNGLATATGPGTTTIAAEANGITATSQLTVTIASTPPIQPVLTITPSTGLAVVTQLGGTTQFLATGNLVGGGPLQNLTNSVQWVSSNAGVATINSAGLATATGTGNTVITAALNGTTATSDLTVTPPGASSLAIIPALGLAMATRVGETTQFLAIGTLGGAGTVQDLTNQVRWVSSDVSVATIDQSGLATGVAAVNTVNTTTITAIATTANGATVTATSSLQIVPTTGTVTLPTLALYKVGLGTGTVASSPAGITCGPQATCTGSFPLNTPVTLTATPAAGSSFGGWSANCVTTPVNTAALTCTVSLSTNDSVGAIFNTP